MAYRYSDTLKWQDEWFVDLTSIEKLLFLYLYDNCDIAGFFELSYRKISFDLGCKEAEIKGALKGLGKGIIINDDEKCLLVKNFIKHQKNLPINPDNKAHLGILKRAIIYLPKFNNITLDYQEGYLYIGASKPLPRGTGIAIDIVYSIEEREKKFKESLYPFTKYDKNPDGIYPKELIKDFYEYWTEKNKTKSKMRFEMQNTWELNKRLVTWSNNIISKNKEKQNLNYSQSSKVSAN